MKTLLLILQWMLMLVQVLCILQTVKLSRELKKRNKLSREMDDEFAALSEAFIKGDMVRFGIHRDRWHELHETWERDFKK